MSVGSAAQSGAVTLGQAAANDTAAPVASVRGATSVLGDLAAIASGKVTAAALSLATALITTRMLGPAGYGTVALVGVVAMLIFTASTAWTGISVRRYGREDLDARGNMSRLTWNRALIGAPLVLVSLTAVVVLKALGALSSTLTWELALIAIATGLVNIVVDHWCCLLETSGKMKISAGGQVLSQAVYVASLAVLVVLGLRASPEDVLLLALVSATLLAVGAAPFVWRTGVRPAGVDRRLLRRMLWLSTPMIGLMVSQYVFGSIDIVALRIFRTQSEVGIYAVSYQAYTVLAAAATTATAVLVPLFVSLQAAGRRPVIERYFRQGVPQGLFLIAVICGLAAAPAPLLVPLVFGHNFSAAATPMAVLIAGLAFLFGAYLAAPILTLHEQTRATAVFNGIAALINVVLDLLLLGVVHMGVIGPALATSAALAFMFAAFYTRARGLLALDTRPALVLMAPLLAGLAPTVILGGALGAVLGVAGVALAAAAILAWRSPFTRSDVDVIAKLDLPPAVKRAAIKLVIRVT